MRKAFLAGIAALGVALVAAPSALASNATISGDTIRVTASPNEINRVLVTYASGTDIYTVTDTGANITASGLCAAVDSHNVSCRERESRRWTSTSAAATTRPSSTG